MPFGDGDAVAADDELAKRAGKAAVCAELPTMARPARHLVIRKMRGASAR
jgi:hypothetical protein